MLPHLFSGLAESTALRAAGAAATALALALLVLPWLVRVAARRRFADREDKSDSARLNDLHASKRSTPIVGGIGILAGTASATLLFADLSWGHVWLLLFTLLGLGALGLADDLAKTFGAARTRGLSARQKLVGQAVVGGVVAAFLLGRAAWGEGGHPGLAELTAVKVPVLGLAVGLGALGFAALALFLVVGASNAVNLTDGLDGLAGGCALVALGVYVAVAAVAGDPSAAAWLGATPVPGAAETCVVLAALAGAVTAFLWFNRHPARVFMGDTGSLPLGGALAVAALLTKQELLLALVGGVFVVEALSVMAQVASFKLTGRRVLRCAPLHHHFEFKGWPEGRIVNRFHAAAMLLGLLGLAGLGLGAEAAW